MIWNPTEGIEIGPITIRLYSLMFVCAFSLGWYIMKKIFDNEDEPIRKLDSLFIWTVLATLVGARLGHVLFYQPELFKEDFINVFLPIRTNPTFEFTGFQGLASHGAAISIIVAMYFFSKKVMKRHLLWLLDRVVIPVSSGAVLVRLGNFFNSEIVGNVTQSPLGIKFIRDTYSANDAKAITKIPSTNDAYNALLTDPKYSRFIEDIPAKHPTQLYEAGCYLVIFGILMFLYWKTKQREKRGFIFGMFLILLWSVRFIIESVKEKQGGLEEALGILSTGQWLSIPFIIAGLYYTFTAVVPLPEIIIEKANDKENHDRTF